GIRDRNVTGVQTCALPIYRLEIAKLAKDVEKAEAENKKNVAQMEVYKDAFEKQKAVSEQQGADIRKQNEEVARLAGVATRYSLKIGRASCRERVEITGGGG